MSLQSKVVWSEGMFLNPQHFQQQERYFESLLEGRCAGLGAYGWGFIELEIDRQLLKLGKVSLLRASGVFSDGTPFNIPESDNSPVIFEVPKNIHEQTVFLCLPLKRAGAIDVTHEEHSPGYARFISQEMNIRDISDENGDQVSLQVGKLRLRMMLGSDDLSGYACLGVLHISESREDGNVLLDDSYMPTCLDCAVDSRLTGFLNELSGLLHHRGEAISARLADTQRGGSAEIADYMMLQLINRLEPLVNHMATVKGLHPQQLYLQLLQMVGELSTFVSKNRRAPKFQVYRHDDLKMTFTPVIAALRNCLSVVYEQSAISLPLVEKKYGIRVAEITDRSLIGSATFILSVRADVAEEIIRSHLPQQIKIGPVERIRQLVNAAMPGIGLKALPVAPRQIPYHSGFTYFQLDSSNEFWKELKHSGGFALHLGGDYPGLQIEFWAIRQ